MIDIVEPYLEIMGCKNAKKKLLCVHGGPGMDYSYFRPYLDSLEKFEDLAVVYYKCGSILNEGTFISQLEELKSVIGYLEENSQSIYLLGHSFGSALVIECLRYKFSKIKGVILCSWIFSSTFRNYMDFVKLSEYTDEQYKSDTISSASSYFSNNFLEEGKSVLEKVTYSGRLFNDLEAEYLSKFNLAENLKSIFIPILSIAGVEDTVVPINHIIEGKKLCKNITHINFKKSKHFPFIEENALFINCLISFLFDQKGEK